MAVFTPEALEPDILNDLKEEIFELYESSLQTLVELELTPNDNEMQRALFRSVHTIKGDLGLVGFVPMIEVLQYLEDILDMLRKGEVHYSHALHDLVISLLDKVTDFVDECMHTGKAKYNEQAIDATSAIIKQFDASIPSQHEVLLKQALRAFTGKADLEKDRALNRNIVIPATGIPKNITPETQADLLFFRELIRPIEKRIGYVEGRADRIAGLALYVNNHSEYPVAEEQLALACYVHDFGVAFMPENTLRKQSKLTEMEKNLLRSHVYKSSRLLEHLPAWDEARKIIMQHHERQDGSGFPLGLKSKQICSGAKLLAIVETYIDFTTQDATGKVALSEIEAIISINQNYKGKFSGNWLRLFNCVMTKYLNQ